MKAGKCRTDAEVLLRSSFFLFSSKKTLQMGHKVADELQRLQIISYKMKNKIANDKLKKKRQQLGREVLLCVWVLSLKFSNASHFHHITK